MKADNYCVRSTSTSPRLQHKHARSACGDQCTSQGISRQDPRCATVNKKEKIPHRVFSEQKSYDTSHHRTGQRWGRGGVALAADGRRISNRCCAAVPIRSSAARGGSDAARPTRRGATGAGPRTRSGSRSSSAARPGGTPRSAGKSPPPGTCSRSARRSCRAG